MNAIFQFPKFLNLPIMALIALLCFTQCSTKHRKVNSESEPVSHQLWDDLLKKNVNTTGNVNYKGFIQDSVKLNEYLSVLSNNHPNDAKWSQKEKLAYWINAYNAFTVKLIVDNYPVKSIKDIVNGPSVPFVNSPWDLSFITIEGQKYDLNNIEHSILRKDFEEPRIHFAINCASISCPWLSNEAYVPERIDEQLNKAAYLFINDPSKNKITPTHLELSKIFSWFQGDFSNALGKAGVLAFVSQFTEVEILDEATVSHLDYDWNLNE